MIGVDDQLLLAQEVKNFQSRMSAKYNADIYFKYIINPPEKPVIPLKKWVFDRTADFFEVPITAVRSKSRKREFVEMRFMFCQYLKEEFSYGPTTLGKLLDKDHSTIIHYFKQHNDLMSASRTYKDTYQRYFDFMMGHQKEVLNEN